MEQTTKPYDVTIAKIGTLRVTATSRDEAMQLAETIIGQPDGQSDIKWIGCDATDADESTDESDDNEELALSVLTEIMEENQDGILFITDHPKNNRKKSFTVAEAKKLYGDRYVTSVCPNIHNGQYIGNIYVIPDIFKNPNPAEPKEPPFKIWFNAEPSDEEETMEKKYVHNTMHIPYDRPTWRLRDTAWVMRCGSVEAQEGTIYSVSVFDKEASESACNTTADIVFLDGTREEGIPLTALFSTKQSAEKHAKGELDIFDVSVTLNGTARIAAETQHDAAILARNFGSNITWGMPIVTKIEKESQEGKI